MTVCPPDSSSILLFVGNNRQLVARCLDRTLADPTLIDLQHIFQGAFQQHGQCIDPAKKQKRRDVAPFDRLVDDTPLEVDWDEGEQGDRDRKDPGVKLMHTTCPPDEAVEGFTGFDKVVRGLERPDAAQKTGEHGQTIEPRRKGSGNSESRSPAGYRSFRTGREFETFVEFVIVAGELLAGGYVAGCVPPPSAEKSVFGASEWFMKRPLSTS